MLKTLMQIGKSLFGGKRDDTDDTAQQEDTLSDPLQQETIESDTLTDPLVSSFTATSTESTPESGEPEGLRLGASGPTVSLMQDQLIAAGYMTAEQKATGPGTFGPKTQAALISFQADKGLPATGIFDVATSAALSVAAGAGFCVAPHEIVQESEESVPEVQEGQIAPETTVQESIIAKALSRASGLSGQSGNDGSWLVDTVGGDGERMRNAIAIWHDWQQAGAPPDERAGVEARMQAAIVTGSDYGSAQAAEFIKQIEAVYTGSVPALDDNAILSYLKIQQQCVEWANRIAQEAGGQYQGHASGAVSTADARPGMGYSNGSHYALITAIDADAEGTPTTFHLAEANWGSGWINPIGMVPWKRTASSGRTVAASSGKVKKHG